METEKGGTFFYRRPPIPPPLFVCRLAAAPRDDGEAVATLRLSTGARIGILIRSLAAADSASSSPSASAPRIIARGTFQSSLVWRVVARTSVPTVRISLRWHQSMTALKVAPAQIGRRKLEPIAPRSAFGEKTSVEPAVVMNPVAPAASATRSTPGVRWVVDRASPRRRRALSFLRFRRNAS